MFEPTNNELANLLTQNSHIGPRRLDDTDRYIQHGQPKPYVNKAEELINTIMEYKNEITFGRCK